jgi:predicted short-subunit dehydrogenase-like oxidoreductase (DUF2520 family)
MKIKKIVIIGAGCVGNFLARELKGAGFEILQIISRSRPYAEELARSIGTSYSLDFSQIDPGADLCILSVKDDSIAELTQKINLGKALIVHTSGSVPMDILRFSSEKYGVLYPLQTILRERKLTIHEIPFFVEASDPATEKTLLAFARSISSRVFILNSLKRKQIHLAAVMASNFSNHLFVISKEILEKAGLPFDILEPLMIETLSKAFETGPEKAQTGPAKRGDRKIWEEHLDMLDRSDWKQLYELFSIMIEKNYTVEKTTDPA